MEYIHAKASDLIGQHAGELLAELGQPAEEARAQAADALQHAREALARWQAIELRRESILTGSDYRHLRTPHNRIQQVALELDHLAANLPDAEVRRPGSPEAVRFVNEVMAEAFAGGETE